MRPWPFLFFGHSPPFLGGRLACADHSSDSLSVGVDVFVVKCCSGPPLRKYRPWRCCTRMAWLALYFALEIWCLLRKVVWHHWLFQMTERLVSCGMCELGKKLRCTYSGSVSAVARFVPSWLRLHVQLRYVWTGQEISVYIQWLRVSCGTVRTELVSSPCTVAVCVNWARNCGVHAAAPCQLRHGSYRVGCVHVFRDSRVTSLVVWRLTVRKAFGLCALGVYMQWHEFAKRYFIEVEFCYNPVLHSKLPLHASRVAPSPATKSTANSPYIRNMLNDTATGCLPICS